ncbi:hypothetical protein CIHG_00557 [Coccidioides immitis H538.4]|uniref:Uncharacterized protein n=1 Tax=Coccidioides immitis H538.4 TaxID=396776 RepID=A0A0J8RC46_COCIT|nr:hypothetical protein CIHG_00557 [Coccidioides immitis H538.4]
MYKRRNESLIKVSPERVVKFYPLKIIAQQRKRNPATIISTQDPDSARLFTYLFTLSVCMSPLGKSRLRAPRSQPSSAQQPYSSLNHGSLKRFDGWPYRMLLSACRLNFFFYDFHYFHSTRSHLPPSTEKPFATLRSAPSHRPPRARPVVLRHSVGHFRPSGYI